MGPLRIIILAVLLYIGYRLIANSFKKSSKTSDNDTSSQETGGKITDVLIEDPICHKLVPKQQAYSIEKDGAEYFFCSKDCCDKFMSEQGDSE